MRLIARRGRVGPGSAAGLGLLEFVVVTAVLVVLAGFLLRALWSVQGEAEQQAFDDNRAALERAINYEGMRRTARGEQRNDAGLGGENPFQWLEPKPPGWGGEYPAGGRPLPGAWYWDSRAKEAVYVPKDLARVEFADKADKGRREIRLRLDPTAGRNSARLVPARPFSWRQAPGWSAAR
jgi:type II secretory pathway pseudopilin PulG